jgi:hypothetical protein
MLHCRLHRGACCAAGGAAAATIFGAVDDAAAHSADAAAAAGAAAQRLMAAAGRGCAAQRPHWGRWWSCHASLGLPATAAAACPQTVLESGCGTMQG